MQDDFNPETIPGEQIGGELSTEQAARADAWENAMADMPEKSYIPLENNEETKRDEGIADAAVLINYGLNAAARELGVETVVQRIKDFDPSGSDNLVRDLYNHLGINDPTEKTNLRDAASASKKDEVAFRESENAPVTLNKSSAGALEAIKDFKELVSEVEGADPRYQELREGAKAAGKGIFEFAVMQYGVRDLTVLFNVLAEQKEQKNNNDASLEETKGVVNDEQDKDQDDTQKKNEDNSMSANDDKQKEEGAVSAEEQSEMSIEEQNEIPVQDEKIEDKFNLL